MSSPIVEGLNSNEIGDETHNLNGHEPEDVNNATNNASTPFTSEEVARQIKTATDPLTKQLKRPCDQMKELRQAPGKRNEETLA